jgi:hypothetical protein
MTNVKLTWNKLENSVDMISTCKEENCNDLGFNHYVQKYLYLHLQNN